MLNVDNFLTGRLRWVPVILYASLIFWLSSQPRPPIPTVPIPYADKGIHFVEFAILCYLICWAQGPSAYNLKKSMWLAVLLTSVYGAADEYHQSFIPFREATAGDWAADTFGAVTAGFAWLRPKRAYLGSTEKSTDVS